MLLASADTEDISRMSLSVFVDDQIKGSFNISGADKAWAKQSLDLGFVMGNRVHFLIISLYRYR